MKYKAGQNVKIKSLGWYNANRDEYGYVDCGSREFSPKMSDLCGKIATIKEICKTNCYHLEEYGFDWTDEMIEGCIESIEDRMKELRKMCTISLTDNNYTDKVEVLLNDYEYIEENGKAYFVKKKKEYPKTYEECCYVLGFENTEMVFEDDYRDINPPKEQWKRLGLMNQLNKLLICRDAYWKIAGEEMGLEKPWKPDWTDLDQLKYCIWVDVGEFITMTNVRGQHILAFPTEEMRDAFKENFDPDIEICKEFL